MGAGKSAVGRALAQRYSARFLDTDKEIERAHGTTIAQIFAELGEEKFRAIERQTVDRLSEQTRNDLTEAVENIVSTGGGLPLRPENAASIRALGTVIWLRARPETIARRVAHKLPQRPLIAEHGHNLPARIAELYEQRAPRYEQLADIIVDTDDCASPDHAAALVANAYDNRARP
jgi:shikimate kinase